MTSKRHFMTIERDGFDGLFNILKQDGYTVVGPTERDGAIVYERLESVRDLPAGRRDHQGPASYRLSDREDQALFGYVVGPHSWKKFLHPPRELFFSAHREHGQIVDVPLSSSPERFAFIGVRSCELAAISIQDKVLTSGPFGDPQYQARRQECFIVAVNCTEPGGTCFCASMNTGPAAREGFDLGITEILGDDRHYFVVESASERGHDVLSRLGGKPSAGDEVSTAAFRLERAALHMGRYLETEGLASLLKSSPDHPRWDDVARRCLNCANCTLVCPTCFCTTVEDTTDLSGQHAERWRLWDSCFTLGFSYIHGGSVRSSAKSRYRQWLTHKLSNWHDQFETSGCVGCGRCISWCPAGIDLTEEARALASLPALTVTATREP